MMHTWRPATATADDLAERALREMNRDKRKQIYWDLQRHIYAAAPAAIPIAWVDGWFFVDRKLQGYKSALAPTRRGDRRS